MLDIINGNVLKNLVRRFESFLLFSLLLFSYTSKVNAQTLIINEVSQGESGLMEYVEFVVVDTAVTYNCSSTTPPCIDIRGWIIDDNNGYHGTSGIASGACRFSYDPIWSCVPLGTIIVVYNDNDPNNQLPADDLSLTDGNCSLVVPISSSFFEKNNTTPGAVACDYPPNGWTSGGTWSGITMANGADCFRIVDLLGCEVFSVCWSSNNQNTMVYFSGGATSSSSATNTVYYFNNGDPTLSSNWSIGCADQPNCGQQDQTPGVPNNTLNANYIAQFNNNCTPITPIDVVADVDQNPTCLCDGSVIANASGSIPGYTYEWFDDSFNSIGQNNFSANGLCAGTYNVIATSSIGCSDTSSVVLSASGSGIGGFTPPLNDTIECPGDLPPSFTQLSDFLNEGGVINGNISNVDVNSFNLFSDVSDGNNCPELISRTYEITDSCGSTFTATHEIFIWDLTSPSASLPSALSVQCFSEVPPANISVITDAVDNCTISPIVTHVSDVSNGNTCPEILTRTFRIEDDCGNFTDVEQLISIIDDTPPTASNPPTTYVDCITDLPPANPSVISDEADNCTSVPIVAFVSENSDGNTCNGEEITRVYSVTDECGNSINVTHTLIIEADVPVFSVSGTDPSDCGVNDGYITINGLEPNETYLLEYDGNPSISITTDGTGSYTITGLGVGSYTGFSITDINCASCTISDSSTVSLTNINAPSIDAGIDQTVCEGNQVVLSANNPDGAVISWSNGVSDGVAFTPTLGIQTYTVTADLAGCIATDQVDITVNPLPNIDAGLDQTVCEGDQVTLLANNPDNAIISWDNGISDNTPFTPATGIQSYTVAADLAGCVSTDQLSLTGNPNPVFTLSSSDPSACSGSDGAITISGLNPSTTYDYSYNGGNTQTDVSDGFGELIIEALPAGSYSNFEVSLNGCSTVDQTILNLEDPEAPNVSAGTDQTIYEGEQVTLSANNPDGAVISWSNGISDGNPFSQGLGIQTYTVTSELAGCTASDQVSVVVNPLPDVNAGADSTICEGDQIVLSASGADDYSWDNGISNNELFSPSETATYTVIGTSNGCQTTDQVTITLNELESVAFEADSLVGCVPLTTSFTNLSSGSNNECVWTLGDGTVINDCSGFSHTYISSGCFDVTLSVTSDEGCVSSETALDYICLDSYPIADFSSTPSIVTTTDPMVHFSNGSYGATDYEWSFGDGTNTEEINPIHVFPDLADEIYEIELIAISQYGCTDTTISNIEVREDLIFYVPNTFTPDGNSYNETFQPVFTSGFDPMNYNLLIFNRWGEIVFESNNAEIGWDGSYGSSPEIVKDGTYIWKISFGTKYSDEKKVHTGHVTLLR